MLFIPHLDGIINSICAAPCVDQGSLDPIVPTSPPMSLDVDATATDYKNNTPLVTVQCYRVSHVGRSGEVSDEMPCLFHRLD